MSTIDGGMANLPDDMGAMTRAITSMATAVENIVSQFPRDAEGKVPAELLRTSSRLALVQCGNNLEYAVDALGRELKWARAKVLSWCAAEAEWKALNDSE